MGKDETAQEDENSKNSQKFGVNLFLLVGCIILFVIVIFLVSIHLGSPHDSGDISFFGYSKSDLGTLGDLLGGALNPILSFSTICLLVWSIQIQISELKETRREMKRSSDALEQNNQMHLQSLNSQKINALIPLAIPKLENIMEDIYEVFRESIFINSIRTPEGLKEFSNKEAYSLRRACLKMEQGISIYDLYGRINFRNTDVTEQINNQTLKLKNRIHDAYEICSTLKRLDVDRFLYVDHFIQCQLIWSNLLMIAQSMNDTKASYQLKKLKNLMVELTPPNYMAHPNSETSIKPYRIFQEDDFISK